MKKFMLIMTLTVAIASVITLNSCKKTETTAADDSISAQDNATVSKAVDATSDDATAAAGQYPSFSGKTEGINNTFFCTGTTVDSTAPNTITITYANAGCFGIIRNGTITISGNGTKWTNAGAVLTVTYNLQITDLSNNNSGITVTGNQTLTKETSGLEWKVLLGQETGPVTRRNQATFSVVFSNGTRTWTVDRTRSWSNATGSNATVNIYTEASGNVDVTGTNRYGINFTNTIVTPIIANASCGFRPYQGEVTHIAHRTVDLKYGTNSTGGQEGNATTCGSGYYITYTKANGTSGTRFVPYW